MVENEHLPNGLTKREQEELESALRDPHKPVPSFIGPEGIKEFEDARNALNTP